MTEASSTHKILLPIIYYANSKALLIQILQYLKNSALHYICSHLHLLENSIIFQSKFQFNPTFRLIQ